EKAFGRSYPQALRLRYVLAGLLVPATLIAFLAGAALTRNGRVLAYGANLMFFLVGWHYVKQGYGILIVDSVQKRMTFNERAKAVLRANGYACWFVSWLALNHAVSTRYGYLGLTYFTLPLPGLVYQAAIAFLIVTSIAATLVLVQRWREAGHHLPWNGVIAYLTTLYLWVIFVRINPLVFAIVPTFHSLQYLAVVWRYQLNAVDRNTGSAPRVLARALPAPWTSFTFFVVHGVLLGFLGFYGLPRSFDSLVPYDRHLLGPSMFLFAFYIF